MFKDNILHYKKKQTTRRFLTLQHEGTFKTRKSVSEDEDSCTGETQTVGRHTNTAALLMQTNT